MSVKKIYTIIKTSRDDRKSEITGTLEYLNDYFSSSSRNAKSIKTLLNRIQAAASDREAALYRRTFYELKADEPKLTMRGWMAERERKNSTAILAVLKHFKARWMKRKSIVS